MTQKKKSSLLEFALIFAVVYLGTQLLFQWFSPAQKASEQGKVLLRMTDATVKEGHHPVVQIINHTDQPLVVPARCPMPPLEVFFIQHSGAVDQAAVQLQATETALPCPAEVTVPVGDTVAFDLGPWKYSLFSAIGTYELKLSVPAGAEPASVRFSLHPAGSMTRLFRTLVTRPLINLLIFIASVAPGYNLGLAIIALTLIVKLALFFPTQHALEGQKEMQKLQPKLEELKRRFRDNPQRMQEETIKLWKEHKINPLQTFVPLLLQFPILIGLFFVIRDGSVLVLSQHLIYAPYQHLSWTFNNQFLGMDLLKPNAFVMAPLLMVLQFLQMKLSFTIAARKKKQGAAVVDITSADKRLPKAEPPSMQETQQKVMQYGLPIMIGVFAFQFPAAVSLYWLVSTLFAIGQQLVVNRKTLA